jgi:hypothetical protein
LSLCSRNELFEESIAIIGDFFPFQPVMGEPLYRSQSENPHTEIYGTPLWHMFKINANNIKE